MKPEAQRIAIAEACGLHLFDGYIGLATRELPDYLNDLNAMHEAEKVLDGDTHYRYSTVFLPMVATRGSHIKTITAITSATAAQRAEAFLRTLGLWRDEA